jgi:1,4-alpha-glucan branching enzyme
MMNKPHTPGGDAVRYDVTRLGEADRWFFGEGSHGRLHEHLGAHLMSAPGGEPGVYFAVWAPHARAVSVIGSFNAWEIGAHPLRPHNETGIWEGFVPRVTAGATYKYHIHSKVDDYRTDKCDPYGTRHEAAPETASVVWPLDYEWGDAGWMNRRAKLQRHDRPISIYEVHLGSWMREVDGEMPGYREIAPRLAAYVHELGYTHVEFLPIMEHPYYGSWGYQSTGYFAPTARHGTPQDLMFLIDTLHQRGIGVILDWVPGHFPNDGYGLGFFDGTHLYEDADPRRGFHPEWKSYIFNFANKGVASFLLSSAQFWAERYHIDGIRVDAVSSMLYLNYAREENDWIPNRHGGEENLDAIEFLRMLNTELKKDHPALLTFAEEATSWPLVSRPAYVGGLGFDFKWDMGWMNDSLAYFVQDPVYRKFHHNKITFRMMYAFNENFLLPLSHDEVVHGKRSLLGRMPGDYAAKFAHLRLLLGNLFFQTGKKLLFMGGDFAQYNEWDHESSLDWHLLDHPHHRGVQRWVRDLNRAYREEPALHELDNRPEGFEWVDCLDNENSVISFLRRGNSTSDFLLAVFNHTPVTRHNYRVGVPREGWWEEVLNSDAEPYAGSGLGNEGGREAYRLPNHHHPWSLSLLLPPLSCLLLKSAGD